MFRTRKVCISEPSPTAVDEVARGPRKKRQAAPDSDDEEDVAQQPLEEKDASDDEEEVAQRPLEEKDASDVEEEVAQRPLEEKDASDDGVEKACIREPSTTAVDEVAVPRVSKRTRVPRKKRQAALDSVAEEELEQLGEVVVPRVSKRTRGPRKKRQAALDSVAEEELEQLDEVAVPRVSKRSRVPRKKRQAALDSVAEEELEQLGEVVVPRVSKRTRVPRKKRQAASDSDDEEEVAQRPLEEKDASDDEKEVPQRTLEKKDSSDDEEKVAQRPLEEKDTSDDEEEVAQRPMEEKDASDAEKEVAQRTLEEKDESDDDEEVGQRPLEDYGARDEEEVPQRPLEENDASKTEEMVQKRAASIREPSPDSSGEIAAPSGSKRTRVARKKRQAALDSVAEEGMKQLDEVAIPRVSKRTRGPRKKRQAALVSVAEEELEQLDDVAVPRVSKRTRVPRKKRQVAPDSDDEEEVALRPMKAKDASDNEEKVAQRPLKENAVSDDEEEVSQRPLEVKDASDDEEEVVQRPLEEKGTSDDEEEVAQRPLEENDASDTEVMVEKRAASIREPSPDSSDEIAAPSGSKRTRVSRKKRQAALDSVAAEELEQLDEIAGPSGSNQSRVSRKKRHAATDTDNEEEVAQRPLQQKRARLTQASQLIPHNPDPKLYHSGKILRMHLINFMSHSNVTITFNPSVTFIIGANGSGKSAIQTALLVALGARAKQTNRASTVKDYVKRGEPYAEIEVVLANVGRPFEPETYGHEIIIKRRICASGMSTYTIKGASGNVVSKNINELHHILLAIPVLVDNPVYVLNQDMARNFLKELEPENCYALFEKACKIDLVLGGLQNAETELPLQELSILREKRTTDSMIAHIAQLKDKLNRVLGMQDLKKRLSEKGQELLWAKVQRLEEELEKCQNALTKLKLSRDKIKQFIDNRETMEEKLKQKANALNSDVDSKTTEYTAANNEIQQLKGQENELGLDRAKHDFVIKDLLKKIELKQRDIRELDKALAENYDSSAENIQELRNQNEGRKRDLEKKKEVHTAIISNLTNDLRMLMDTKQRMEDEINDYKSQKKTLQQNLETTNKYISDLEASTKDKLAIYGNPTKIFIADLRKLHMEGQLSEMPIGPIGQYVEVPNAKYRDIIEHLIGHHHLTGFIVNSTPDRARIEALIKRKYPQFRPVIITARFLKQVYDVAKGRAQAPSGTRLVMTEIRCPNPTVMNCLIDRVYIEATLIADNKEVAERVTQNRENVPRNLKKVLVPSGMEYFPEPNYRMYSIAVKPARYIQVGVKDRITQLRAEGEELTANIQSLEESLKGLYNQQIANNQQLKSKSMHLKTLQGRIQELEAEVTDIDNFDYPELQDLTVLKKEKAELESTVAEWKATIASEKNAVEAVQSSLRDMKASIYAKDEELRALQTDIDSTRRKWVDVNTEIRNLKTKFEVHQQKIVGLDEQISQVEASETAVSQSLAAALTEATAASDQRVTTTSSEEDIEDEIAKLQRSIARCKAANIDPEEIQQELEIKEKELEIIKKEYDLMVAGSKDTKDAVVDRVSYLAQTRKCAAVKLKYSFNSIMDTRGYKGHLTVDSDQRKIHIEVVPRDKHVAKAATDTKALSGGERSFTTICFLLALWRCSDHPFFFLDEYDVFTDEVNRETITRLLLYHAEKHKNQQFIFMTPQAMTLKSSDDVSIVRFHKNAEA